MGEGESGDKGNMEDGCPNSSLGGGGWCCHNSRREAGAQARGRGDCEGGTVCVKSGTCRALQEALSLVSEKVSGAEKPHCLLSAFSHRAQSSESWLPRISPVPMNISEA